jgi:hypothetical protein
LEPDAIWLAVRVYLRNFVNLIEGGDAVTRVLAGSVPRATTHFGRMRATSVTTPIYSSGSSGTMVD